MQTVAKLALAAAFAATLSPASAAPPAQPASHPDSALPRYVFQPIDPLSTPAAYAGAPARILAFDAAGHGFGYSLTGSAGAPIVAVRWDRGLLAPLPTPAGAVDSHAAGVNGAGDVVGWFRTRSDVQGGAVWRDGEVESLAGEMMPLGINSAGTIAGVVRNPAAPRRLSPAISHDGRITLLPMNPEGAHGWVVGVSGSGDVAGSWYAGAQDHRAVRWVGGVAEELALPAGAARSEARAMNEAGWIVGAAYMSGSAANAAVLWRDGSAIDLGVLDAATPDAWAQSINNSNQVVGFAQTSTGPTAFLWQDGAMHDLRDLIDGGIDGFNAGYLVIGDSGHIAGVRYLADGSGQAFVLVPVPAPSGFLLLTGAAMAWRRRSR